MAFKTLSINNFRGIRDLELRDLGLINLFVGNNNSGKTSVLEAIFLTIGISNPGLAITVDLFRNMLHLEPGDFQFIFYDLDYKNEPVLKASLDDDATRELRIHPTFAQLASGDKASVPNASSSSAAGLRVDGIEFDFSIKKKHSHKESHKAILKFPNNQVQPSSYKETLTGIFLSTYNIANVESLNRLNKALVDKKKNEILKALQIIDPSIKDVMIGANNLIYVDTGLTKFIPINIEGEGLNKLLAIITAIFSARNGILIIDEIENGFYHKSMLPIWKAMLTAAEAFHVQLFISTHNTEILEKLRLTLEETELSHLRNQISHYTFVRKEDRSVEAIRYSYDQFENAIAKNIEIR